MPFRINFAEGQSDFDISRRLFLEYAETLGFSLCFQGFDEELENRLGNTQLPKAAFYWLGMSWIMQVVLVCVHWKIQSVK
jgi:hypothetical protein